MVFQVFLFLLLFILIIPFLIPVPRLTGTVTAESLADLESQFIEINGLKIHLKKSGQGKPVFVLLHGFGASLYSWNAVFDAFSRLGTVIAFDRPAFGLSERPLKWKGNNPYNLDSQVELLIGLLDHFGIERAILVGNSAGGTIALKTCLAHPDRVTSLILVDPAVFNTGGIPSRLLPIFKSPQMHHLGPLVARKFKDRGQEMLKLAWHAPELLTDEIIDLYKKPLNIFDWDKALWEFTLSNQKNDLKDHLKELKSPVLVITGDDDRIVPTSESVLLSKELPAAQLILISDAGHVPHEEKPLAFMDAVQKFSIFNQL